jgi:hypothetical protein
MDRQSTQPRKAQLDKAEREHLEDIVTKMRERVEANVRYQLEEYDLGEEPDKDAFLNDEREDIVEAIELETVDGNYWDDGYEQYITGVGYTIVNRLAALRCMEVRDFIDDEVTRFREDGLTPAADRLVTEEYMLEEEAVLEAYQNACDNLAEEIEILFDRSSAYSLIDPDHDTFEDLCVMLDEVPDEVWRADDVLGWVYEYYNVKLLDNLRRKGERQGLEPEDVPPANQFYTPHWVVRMLTDNSLGKLYLEDTGELQSVVDSQTPITPQERKNRPLSPEKSAKLADFCTYIVPSEESGEPPEFGEPADLRVIDPACGSGHFLLYAFDILERIWRNETDFDHKEIPHKVLKHNLYGIDLDMRACQLAAFNLYLKGRTRTEAEGGDDFEMPKVGVVCADAKIADIDGIEDVFEEVISNSSSIKSALNKDDVEGALNNIVSSFEDIHGLGSLLNVRGTLGKMFDDEDEGLQLTFEDDFTADYTLSSFLHTLQEAIAEQDSDESFLAQDLRSFIRLIDILAQEYDVALMNPPYGSRKRMPDEVTEYVEEHYKYNPEYYINFFEVCDNITKENGRIGMLIPRSFMFKKWFKGFREDFVGGQGVFDFLAEFGLGVLDNATVRTAATVVRSGIEEDDTGSFIRLYDVESESKEGAFLDTISRADEREIKRLYNVQLSEFSLVPETPLSYSIPSEVRHLHDTNLKIDADVANIEGESISTVAQGLATGNNDRFLRKHWESVSDNFRPYAKGGADAWIIPPAVHTVNFNDGGREIRAAGRARFQNSQFYEKEGLSWTYIKDTGRRFGYLPEGYVFDVAGSMVFPKENYSSWRLMSVLNSDLYHCLFLSLTPERQWNQGDVGRMPWVTELNDDGELIDISKEQYQLMISQRVQDPTSPFYIAPALLPKQSDINFFYDHPVLHRIEEISKADFNGSDPSWSLTEAAQEARQQKSRKSSQLEQLASKVDEIIYEELCIQDDVKQKINSEITLRSGENPGDRESSSAMVESTKNIQQQIKLLLHHFAIDSIQKKSDGIVPIHSEGGHSSIFDEVRKKLENAYDGYAEDRLAEIDDLLGNIPADEEAYPNIRDWLSNNLFRFHTDTMENTPIVWKVSTSALMSDTEKNGFACFIDYEKLDASLFDRLNNQYLEPRKAELRERRSAANQRQNNESLSSAERAEATEEFEFCTNALEQISVFEEVIQELAMTNIRDWDQSKQNVASNLGSKVMNFRKETEKRLDLLDELAQKDDTDIADIFTETFYSTVQKERKEWIGALSELQEACEAYSRDSSEPVEAHYYDYFTYFDEIIGSTHFASNGILFMTYYFDDGTQYLEDGVPKEGLSEESQILAELAVDLEDYVSLAEDINEECKQIAKSLPSKWEERALSDVLTQGYQPKHKYGVRINIKPLSDKSIVPDVVENRVL